MTCTSTRARPLSRGLSRSWEARRTRSRGRKLGFGLFGVVGAVLVMAGPAAAQELEFMPAGDIEALLASLWLIVAGCLVFLMQAGFALVEAGLTRAKNIGNIMAKNLADMAIGALAFWAVGFGFAFGSDSGSLIGTDNFFLSGMSDEFLGGGDVLATPSFFFFQVVFAATAVTIASGAMAERTRFPAYLAFSAVMTGFIYPVVVHSFWHGDGILSDLSIGDARFSDFAGSSIVHSAGGWAALMGAVFLGPRIGKYAPDGSPRAIPGHNIGFVVVGVFILWFGWFGFNAGSELAVDGITAVAFINTQIAAAFAAITWLLIAWHYDEKPSFVEMLIGMIAGLATITPAAGFVSPQSAMVIGVAAGVVCYFAVVLRKQKGLDDALDVWGVHGVGGCLGIIMLGVLASTKINPAGADGLMSGSSDFFMAEVGGLALACAWAFIFTYGMLYAIDQVTPVRVDEGDETGMDVTLHGESAYTD